MCTKPLKKPKLQYFLPLETKNHVKRFIATHFYFEQEGSYVTLTKKERLQHQSLMNRLLNDTTRSSNSLISIDQNNCANWVTVTYEDNRLIVIPRK
jgi:membrane-bound lytic murein transglycosylase D